MLSQKIQLPQERSFVQGAAICPRCPQCSPHSCNQLSGSHRPSMLRCSNAPLQAVTAMTVSRYKWQVVAMLWAICFFNYADRQAIFSVFPLLEKEFRLGPVELGLLGSAFAWVYGLGAPLAG